MGRPALASATAGYPQVWKKNVGTVGITAVGMFGNGAGWGIPPALSGIGFLGKEGKKERQDPANC